MFLASPLLAGDNEDVIEEEAIDVVSCCSPNEDAAVLHIRRQLTTLQQPARRRHQRERLRVCVGADTEVQLQGCMALLMLRTDYTNNDQQFKAQRH